MGKAWDKASNLSDALSETYKLGNSIMRSNIFQFNFFPILQHCASCYSELPKTFASIYQ